LGAREAVLRYSTVRGMHFVKGRRFLMTILSLVPNTDAISLLIQVRFKESFPTATLSALACTCLRKLITLQARITRRGKRTGPQKIWNILKK
jgi:hypothetical protein